MRTDFPTLLNEHKITPDLCDGLLSRITDVMKKTHEVFRKYISTRTMSMRDIEDFLCGYDVFNNIEAVEVAMFQNIKSGGDEKTMRNFKDTALALDNLFYEGAEEGIDEDTFDFLALFDSAFQEEFGKLLNFNKRRLDKLSQTATWMADNVDAMSIHNFKDYDLDYVEDIENEYEYKYDRIFEDFERIAQEIRVFKRYKEIREKATQYGLSCLFHAMDVISSRFDRYESSLSPVEYVRKYVEDVKKDGQLVMHTHVYLRVWEDDRPIEVRDIEDEEIKNVEVENNTPSGAVASVSNSPMFNKEFFSMSHVEHLHKACNGYQFEEISPGDMYLIINLQHSPRNLKVRLREKARVCHLIYFLGEMLPDVHRLNWRKSMLNHLDISYSTYNKKYKEATSELSSKQDDIFIEKLDDLKEIYRELEKAA